MIKYVIQVKPNYDYKIVQLNLLLVSPGPGQNDFYTIDRAAYDNDYAATRAAGNVKGYYGNKIWKVPVQFRRRNCQIDTTLVFDTREDAGLAGMRIVEDQVRKDILDKKMEIDKLEQDISNLSNRVLSPKVQFVNGSTMVLKKGRNP